MNRKIRIGIAGAGQMGRAHAQAFATHGVEIVGIVDSDSERAKDLAQSSVAQLLGMGLDALSICLPHSLHFDVAMMAVDRGVHLLIEKPHCVTLDESRRLRAACAEKRIKAMAGFTHRFLQSSIEIERRLRAGYLGRVELMVDRLIANGLGAHAPDWYRRQALAGGGIAMIGMIHSIDRLRWLVGAEITTVQSLTRHSDPGSDVETTGLALLEFASGAQASLIAHRSPVKGHERTNCYELFGTKANASCSVGSFSDQRLVLQGEEGRVEKTYAADQPFKTEIGEFLAAIADDREPSPNLVDAEIALGVVLAIYESAKSRQPISMSEFIGDLPAKLHHHHPVHA